MLTRVSWRAPDTRVTDSSQSTCAPSALCLTNKRNCHKLVTVNSVSSAISDLEHQAEQLLGRYEVLRKENAALRQQLLEAQAGRDELRRRIDQAASRLESLKARLPADA